MQNSPDNLAKKIKEQLFFWQGENVESILKQLETFAIKDNLNLSELACSVYSQTPQKQTSPCNLAITVESLEDLKTKIASVKKALEGNPKVVRDSKGIYFSSSHLAKNGKIAFLFSGQASQRPNMLKDLKDVFPQVNESIKKADSVLKGRFPKLLSEYIYPPSPSTPEQEKQQMAELTQTNITQPALGVVEMGLFKVMKFFNVKPDMLAGHSLGEYTALSAAGVFDEEALYDLLEYRGTAIVNSSKDGKLGGMLAVGANADDIKDMIKGIDEVYLANLNSPKQTILSGDEDGLNSVSVRLKEKGFRSMKINVSCAFHSPYMSAAKELLFKKLSALEYKYPVIPVYSNFSAEQYPNDKGSPPAAKPARNLLAGGRADILSILSEHLVSPVRFVEEIENMFNDRARAFIEIGPGNVLTNLVKQILGEKDYVAIASNVKTATDTSQFLNVLAQLVVEGFEVDLEPLYPTS